MIKLKENTWFKIFALVLALSLLAPTFVKFTHIFSHHKHEVCLGEKTTHLHKYDRDCDFYKFKLSNSLIFNLCDISLFSKTEIPLKTIRHYFFLVNYQNLHFSLRAPPSLVL